MKRISLAALAVLAAVACAQKKEQVKSESAASAAAGSTDAGTPKIVDPGTLSTQGKASGLPASTDKKVEQAVAKSSAQRTGASGIEILELPANDQAVVNVQLRFRSGAIEDPPGKAGLTWLTAQIMVEGGTRNLDAKQLLNALFPLAAELDARVDKEQTTFWTRVHRDNLDKLLPILTDVLLHPRWDPQEFKRIREVAVNDVEKRLRQGDDENLGKESLYEVMYKGHPYGRYTGGHAADLKSITLGEVKAHAQKVFTADRLVVGVSGGAPKGLADQLAQTLATLPAKSEAPAQVPQQAPHGPRYVLVEKNADSTAISMGIPWQFSRADADWPALSVARSAFGEHRQFNGRLMQRLREMRGLNYGDYAYIEYFRQEAGDAASAQLGRARHQQDFTIWVRPVRNENRLFAVRAALYELGRSVKDEPFTAEEVEKTKGFLDGYILLFDQTDQRKLGYALDDAFFGMSGFLGSWRAALRSVTTDQVNSAWRKWIDPSQIEVVLAGKDMAAARKIILANEPTPIQYQKDPSGKSPEKPKAQLDTDAQIEQLPFGAQGDADVVIIPVDQMFE